MLTLPRLRRRVVTPLTEASRVAPALGPAPLRAASLNRIREALLRGDVQPAQVVRALVPGGQADWNTLLGSLLHLSARPRLAEGPLVPGSNQPVEPADVPHIRVWARVLGEDLRGRAGAGLGEAFTEALAARRARLMQSLAKATGTSTGYTLHGVALSGLHLPSDARESKTPFVLIEPHDVPREGFAKLYAQRPELLPHLQRAFQPLQRAFAILPVNLPTGSDFEEQVGSYVYEPIDAAFHAAAGADTLPLAVAEALCEDFGFDPEWLVEAYASVRQWERHLKAPPVKLAPTDPAHRALAQIKALTRWLVRYRSEAALAWAGDRGDGAFPEHAVALMPEVLLRTVHEMAVDEANNAGFDPIAVIVPEGWTSAALDQVLAECLAFSRLLEILRELEETSSLATHSEAA